MQVRKQQLELDMKQQTGSKSGNTGLDEAQPEIEIVGEISITSDIQFTPHLWQKVKKK